MCGRIRAYQLGAALVSDVSSRYQSLDKAYVHGISITHGLPQQRQHIWTFAVGIAQEYKGFLRTPKKICKCSAYGAVSPPSFVEDEYSCQSGVTGHWGDYFQFRLSAPLWEEQSCSNKFRWINTCCSRKNPRRIWPHPPLTMLK